MTTTTESIDREKNEEEKVFLERKKANRRISEAYEEYYSNRINKLKELRQKPNTNQAEKDRIDWEIGIINQVLDGTWFEQNTSKKKKGGKSKI